MLSLLIYESGGWGMCLPIPAHTHGAVVLHLFPAPQRHNTHSRLTFNGVRITGDVTNFNPSASI